MEISMTTDFGGWYGPPEPQLKLIAEAGFTHLHWCHHYNSDFLYRPCEISAMRRAVASLGLKVLDVHGSHGQEKRYWSLLEYEREAGIELIRNRAELYSGLEASGALIMHLPHVTVGMEKTAAAQQREFMKQAFRSLDEVMPYLETLGVKVAFENMPNDNWEVLDAALKRYPQAGICYDSGHGNRDFKHYDAVFARRSRLTTLHLNDNNGKADQHVSPFMGTVDWERVVAVIADSPYDKPLSFELCMRDTPFQKVAFTPVPSSPAEDQRAYLADAMERCSRVCAMYEAAKKQPGK